MPADAAEEQLVAGTRLPRWTVLAGAALAVSAAVVALLVHSGSPARHPKAARPSGWIPALYAMTPVPTSTDADSCPANVLCSVLSTSPQALDDAVQAYLPHAVVRRVHSVDYVAPDQHRVVVWYRELELRAGVDDVVVVVREPKAGDRDGADSYLVGGERGVRLQRVFFDRVVSVTLQGTDAVPTLAQLRAFAADARLVAT